MLVQFYQVATSVGIIKRNFRGGDLASSASDMTTQLSIREAAVKIGSNARENATVHSVPASSHK